MPRRTVVLLPGLFALLVLLAGHVRAVEPPTYVPAGPGDIYLALGDSLPTGDEVPANTTAEGDLPGYPVYLDQIFDQTRPITLTLLAQSSESSSTMRAPGGQLEQAVAYIGAQRAANNVVSPVTLSIGGNDMVSTFLGLQGPTQTITDTLPLFRDNLALILDTLLDALTEEGQRTGDLILMNYYNPYPGLTIRSLPPFIILPPGQEPIVTDVEVPRFNQIIAEEAAIRGIPVVNAFSRFQGREPTYLFVRFPYDFTDIPNLTRNFDYHPRAEGHWNLAYGFAEASGYPLKLPQATLPMMSR